LKRKELFLEAKPAEQCRDLANWKKRRAATGTL